MNDLLIGFLRWIYSWIGSWGWAMVVFTLLIRVVLSPLDYKSRLGMRKMQNVQPKLAVLQQKYANDKEKLNQKTAELYKKEGVNPLSSCLPLLLTWPILIIVFNAMRAAANTEMLAQVAQLLDNQDPKLEQWLWIKNLWMADSPFTSKLPDATALQAITAEQWQNWFKGLDKIPSLVQELPKELGWEFTVDSFTNDNLRVTLNRMMQILNGATITTESGLTVTLPGNPIYAQAIHVPATMKFNLWFTTLEVPDGYNGFLILPLLSCVSQLLMTKVTGNAQQQPADGQNAGTGKFMQWFFPIFSFVICFGYSSAFALYWVAGNIIMMGQTVILNKIIDKKQASADAVKAEGSVK